MILPQVKHRTGIIILSSRTIVGPVEKCLLLRLLKIYCGSHQSRAHCVLLACSLSVLELVDIVWWCFPVADNLKPSYI